MAHRGVIDWNEELNRHVAILQAATSEAEGRTAAEAIKAFLRPHISIHHEAIRARLADFIEETAGDSEEARRLQTVAELNKFSDRLIEISTFVSSEAGHTFPNPLMALGLTRAGAGAGTGGGAEEAGRPLVAMIGRAASNYGAVPPRFASARPPRSMNEWLSFYVAWMCVHGISRRSFDPQHLSGVFISPTSLARIIVKMLEAKIANSDLARTIDPTQRLQATAIATYALLLLGESPTATLQEILCGREYRLDSSSCRTEDSHNRSNDLRRCAQLILRILNEPIGDTLILDQQERNAANLDVIRNPDNITRMLHGRFSGESIRGQSILTLPLMQIAQQVSYTGRSGLPPRLPGFYVDMQEAIKAKSYRNVGITAFLTLLGMVAIAFGLYSGLFQRLGNIIINPSVNPEQLLATMTLNYLSNNGIGMFATATGSVAGCTGVGTNTTMSITLQGNGPGVLVFDCTPWGRRISNTECSGPAPYNITVGVPLSYGNQDVHALITVPGNDNCLSAQVRAPFPASGISPQLYRMLTGMITMTASTTDISMATFIAAAILVLTVMALAYYAYQRNPSSRAPARHTAVPASTHTAVTVNPPVLSTISTPTSTATSWWDSLNNVGAALRATGQYIAHALCGSHRP